MQVSTARHWFLTRLVQPAAAMVVLVAAMVVIGAPIWGLEALLNWTLPFGL